jgi:hypothetical protein
MIGAGILMVLGYVLVIYLVARFKIARDIPDAIDKAEDLKEAGVRKIEFAVDNLYDFLPKICKLFISKAMIKKLVQAAFEKVENYAKKQLAKKQAEVPAEQ